MNIERAKSFSKDRAPVFLLKQKEKLEKHPFFGFLNKTDRGYLLAFQKKSPLKPDHNHLIFLPGGSEVLLLGLPERSKFNHRKALLAARRVIFVARRERIKNIAVNLDDLIVSDSPRDRKELAELLAMEFQIANFEFVEYKTKPSEGWFFVEEVAVATRGNLNISDALTRGRMIGEEVNHARTLANTPGGDMTPKSLAASAVRAGKENGFKVTVLEAKEMEKLGMGGVLGVAKGSSEEPRFIVMEYMKGKKSEAPVVLVGKGVTFDTGGLNLKPTSGIYEMHMDMSGGAAVIHAIAALARIKAKKNIVGLVPAVENMPSGSSYRPGDVLRTMSGKTIEVLDTDAEGRVILSDALTYAARYKPRLIVDVATLTGAAMSALGQRASALFATSEKLERALCESGERTGDFVWPMPLWEEYEEEIKGTFGDWANIGKTKYGGAINGAVFLWQFVKGHAWAHIDIAPRMTAIEGDFLVKGASGAAVPLLAYFLRKF